MFEESKEGAGDVAFEASVDIATALALDGSTIHVGDRGRVEAHAVEHNCVYRTVELAVTAAVQSVPVRSCLTTPELGTRPQAARTRPHYGDAGCDQAHKITALVIGPTPGCASSCEATRFTIVLMAFASSAASASNAITCRALHPQCCERCLLVSRAIGPNA